MRGRTGGSGPEAGKPDSGKSGTGEARLPTQPDKPRREPIGAPFLKEWLRSPLKIGAVTPSSKALGRLMASFVPLGPHTAVLELGPGTGVVTRCLLDGGVAENRLACLESAPEFCLLLRALHPRAHIVQGDAYRPDPAIRRWIAGHPLAAVVSSLPLMARPEPERAEVISRYLDLLPPGAPFIQFTYSPSLPVRPERIGASAAASRWIKRNLPPARVVIYRRPADDADAARPCPVSSI